MKTVQEMTTKELVEFDTGGKLGVEPMPTGEARFERLKRLVDRKTFATFAYDNSDGCLICDMQTAHAVVHVANALKPEHRTKFLAMDFGVMVDTTWKLLLM